VREVFNNYVSSSVSPVVLTDSSYSNMLDRHLAAHCGNFLIAGGYFMTSWLKFCQVVLVLKGTMHLLQVLLQLRYCLRMLSPKSKILLLLLPVIVSAACSSVHPVTTEPVTNFTAPRLPVASPSIITSSIGTGKCTHDDTLADLDTMSHMSTHPSLTGRMVSTTLISESPPAKKPRSAHHNDILMTSAAWASKLMPATTVIGMQGAINCIGDILDKVVSNAAPISPSSSTPAPAPAPAPPPPQYLQPLIMPCVLWRLKMLMCPWRIKASCC